MAVYKPLLAVLQKVQLPENIDFELKVGNILYLLLLRNDENYVQTFPILSTTHLKFHLINIVIFLFPFLNV